LFVEKEQQLRRRPSSRKSAVFGVKTRTKIKEKGVTQPSSFYISKLTVIGSEIPIYQKASRKYYVTTNI